MDRRTALLTLCAAGLVPQRGLASTPQEVWWEDLIPQGVPYSEIIGEGDMDVANDTWVPIYDANGVKVNDALNDVYMRMPGYIVPLEYVGDKISEFLLVPYPGACVHIPPPPPNQLIHVKTTDPWPDERSWEAVWVTGTIRTELRTTQLGKAGYAINSDAVDLYEW